MLISRQKWVAKSVQFHPPHEKTITKEDQATKGTPSGAILNVLLKEGTKKMRKTLLLNITILNPIVLMPLQ